MTDIRSLGSTGRAVRKPSPGRSGGPTILGQLRPLADRRSATRAAVLTFPAAVAGLFAVACQPAAAQSPGEKPGPYSAASGAPSYTCVTNVYVDAETGSDANPGTLAKPWKTIQNADNGYPNIPVAGECVNIQPGTYTLSATTILAHGGNLNTPSGFLVYRSIVPQATHVVAAPSVGKQGNGDLIMVWAPYIIIDGLDIDGASATNGHGIDGCANGGQPGNIAHHLTVMNSAIHDMGGAGISTCSADFVKVQHNVVYGTSWGNPYEVSGIDLWAPKALPSGSYKPTAADSTRFGIVISYNIVYDNAEGPSIKGQHTDGNGIIIDTTLGSSVCATCGTPYPGNILVLGNVSYDNGGGGIHVFLSQNVTVANNTVYNNYLDPQNPGTLRGELSNGGSRNIAWVNNIAVAVPGVGPLANNKPMVTFPVTQFPDSGTWTSNIGFGAPVVSDAASNISPSNNLLSYNPLLANPGAGLFTPLPGSRAIGTGVPESYLASESPDIGAY